MYDTLKIWIPMSFFLILHRSFEIWKWVSIAPAHWFLNSVFGNFRFSIWLRMPTRVNCRLFSMAILATTVLAKRVWIQLMSQRPDTHWNLKINGYTTHFVIHIGTIKQEELSRDVVQNYANHGPHTRWADIECLRMTTILSSTVYHLNPYKSRN